MTGEQSRALQVSNRVYWRGDLADRGIITETNWAGVTVKWESRGEQNILHNDMGSVTLLPIGDR
jgi:hypothetical protein